MHELIEGAERFRREHAPRYRELFDRLARDGQHPHTLFITCADSRVVPGLVTASQPGDLFVVRNVGNIVPPPDHPAGSHSVGAAIEYAVGALGVSQVVVCGHTQCGAMNALLSGNVDPAAMPHLAEWITLLEPVRDAVQAAARDTDEDDADIGARLAAECNVRIGMENLRRYPAVAARLAAGNLSVHGWMFSIATATITRYDADRDRFVPLSAT